MGRNWQISRRTAIALPLLDSMVTSAVEGAVADVTRGAAAGPTRMAAFFMPNGVNHFAWSVKDTGADYELSPSLVGLKPVKQDVTVLSGLTLDNARAKGDGPGDHARSAAAFLTGAHPYKTAGSNIKLGVSMDQYAARQIGDQTHLPSLELGLDRSQPAGDCDSGYACAYVSNISWRSDTTPVPKEIDPGSVFDRLFGVGNDALSAEARARRLATRKSILDFVAEDSQRLAAKLGKADQQKLDEFTSSIREIEKRIEKARVEVANFKPPKMGRPDGIPAEFKEHVRLMMDMLALSFQMDLTRISSFMFGRDGSDRGYRFLGVTEGHHTLSHHGNNQEKVDQIRKIDAYLVSEFVYFVEKLKSIKEGDANLLDRSLLLFGSGIGDGNRHNHEDLPILLAGRGNGAVTPGRHIRFPRNTPLTNLYLNMFDAMGVKADRFSDSTGRLEGLKA
jgi:Protein of unknown function (DUF1552)